MPLIATETALVSQWIAGQVPDYSEMRDYMSFLKDISIELEKEGKMDPILGVDKNPENYRVNNMRAKKLGERYIAIDPILNKLSLLD